MATASEYRTALVTGASRGIGAAIVRALRDEALEVWALAQSSEALDALAAETGCRAVGVDLTDDAATAAAIDGLSIDVLVNNVGMLTAMKPYHEMAAGEIDAMLSLNLRAPMHITRALLPGMVGRGRGHIFTLTSLFGPYAAPKTAVYSATKAALRSFSACLRVDLAGTGVRVTEIAPGRTETTIYIEAFDGDADALREALFEGYRTLQPQDVAAVLIAALKLPPHADASIIELSPTDQAAGGTVFARSES